MTWPAMTAMVPAMEMGALEGAAVVESGQTQAIGRVQRGAEAMFFITERRTKTPETRERQRFTNMKNWRSQRSCGMLESSHSGGIIPTSTYEPVPLEISHKS